MKNIKRFAAMTAKDIAYISIMTAILIGGQFALSFTYGLEVVTVLLLCFSYVFGVRRGMLTATAFSLLRNFVFGFFPTVFILYLIYYNLFALLCGLCGKNKSKAFECILFHVLFLALVIACVYFLVVPLKMPISKRKVVKAFLIVFLVLFTLAVLCYDGLWIKKAKGRHWQTVLFMTAVGCFCTVCFSLLDDIITPLFFGYSSDATYAYFVGSFLAMLPQTACAFATISVLFFPLTKIFDKFNKTVVKKMEDVLK